jgi:hypothetical protein
MSVKMRQEVERKIATALVKEALAAGYTITVDYGDGETGKLSSLKAILKGMFQGDEDRLHMYNPTNDQYIGWVYFVYGNDGYDVISDYTVNLEPIMGPANKISDHYAD